MSALRLLRAARDELAQAGVETPQADAEVLLAHVLGISRAELVLANVEGTDEQVYSGLVARRAAREPLQHLTGVAWFRHVELLVGPGVFVPRPETELLAGWAIEQAHLVLAEQHRPPVVVDLCTGSGAIARSVIDEVPAAVVHAVELDPAAHRWASQNLDGTGVDLRLGSLEIEFEDLVGTVDVLVANPPYIPLEAWESVAPEARDHDPELALFSGTDGLDAIRAIARRGARLLRSGGVIGVEHAEAQGDSAPRVFVQAGEWTSVIDHRDLAGRPRYLTARLAR